MGPDLQHMATMAWSAWALGVLVFLAAGSVLVTARGQLQKATWSQRRGVPLSPWSRSISG
jgi:hypothetical protein